MSESVDVLFHEASGASIRHSSASQAGEVARKAKVGSLYLIHYPTGKFAWGDLVAEARSSFSGNIILAKDFMTLNFGIKK